MQRSRSSWDIKFSLESELPTTYYSLSLLSPYWRGISFAHLISCILSSSHVACHILFSDMDAALF